MARAIAVRGKSTRKGAHMTKGSTWRLVAVSGRKRDFPATLLATVNKGSVRLAIFSVPKSWK